MNSEEIFKKISRSVRTLLETVRIPDEKMFEKAKTGDLLFEEEDDFLIIKDFIEKIESGRIYVRRYANLKKPVRYVTIENKVIEEENES